MSLAGVNCFSVRLTHKQLTQNSRVNYMANKKNIKVRDLKPAKDAKGGGGPHAVQGGPHAVQHGGKPPKHVQGSGPTVR
jgi:hypothetical protein